VLSIAIAIQAFSLTASILIMKIASPHRVIIEFVHKCFKVFSQSHMSCHFNKFATITCTY